VSLGEIQRRLWRLIAWPEGVRAALREESPDAPPLETLIKSDERLAAEDRLDVYANAYFYRIHDVLAEDFPTLASALGEEDFHDLVTSYLAVHPSESPSLRWIGDRLSGFLADHDAAASIRAMCPFASDLATYEWATQAVFDAPNSEAVRREDLAAVPPEDWAALPIQLDPSVRLLDLDWPVQLLRAAQREEQELPDLDPEPTTLCLWRHDERVVHRELDPHESRALSATNAGTDFGSLCVAVAEDVGEDKAPALAAGWLARWVDDGLIRALSPLA
jgi:hypothetical protein